MAVSQSGPTKLADGAKGYASRVEIHINIWKGDQRNVKRRFDLFDVGLRFKEIRSLRTLSIALPFLIDKSQISDLFYIMLKIGRRIRINRRGGGSARCNASRALAQRRNSCRAMQPSSTPSTSNAISPRLRHTGRYAPRR